MREENNFRRLASLFYKNFLYDNRFPYVGVANCKNPKLNLLFFLKNLNIRVLALA